MEQTLTDLMKALKCTRPCAEGYVQLHAVIREMMETKKLAWGALLHHALLWYEENMLQSRDAVTEQARWEFLGQARKAGQFVEFFESIFQDVERIINPPEEEKAPDWDL